MVVMGNDDFILHIRKYPPAGRPPWRAAWNVHLGRRIWSCIQDNDPEADYVRGPNRRPVVIDCLWDDDAPSGLPKTAHQFRFNRNLLPALYTFLEELAQQR